MVAREVLEGNAQILPNRHSLQSDVIDWYSKGDEVTVYVGEDDTDIRYHGVKYIITDCLQDDLNTETGRDRDQYLYRVKRRSTDEVLPIDFRHGDLVPTTTLSEHSSEDDY